MKDLTDQIDEQTAIYMTIVNYSVVDVDLFGVEFDSVYLYNPVAKRLWQSRGLGWDELPIDKLPRKKLNQIEKYWHDRGGLR